MQVLSANGVWLDARSVVVYGVPSCPRHGGGGSRSRSRDAIVTGVPGKIVAQVMGHPNADVTLNGDTQVLDASLRTSVDRMGGELFTIVYETGVGLNLML